MKIYITRHGETEWNKEGRMQGWKNSNLTEDGIENAIRLGNRLKDIEFDCIYCSPLGRAVDTAKYIRQDKKTEIVLVDSLKEMGFGKWEGMEQDMIKKLHPTEYFNFWNKPHLYNPIEGESFDELFERVKSVLNQISNNSENKNILVVSHAVVIKVIYAIIKKYPLEELWGPPFLQGTSLTIIEVEDNGTNIILEADTSHLLGEISNNINDERTNQPKYIDIDADLRLRKFDGKFDFALAWYKDEETVKLVDGEDAELYDTDKLERMYNYLNNKGELYFIEVKEGNKYIPIGDVTFWKDDMPIVIGNKDYRGKGIGYKVIKALIQRAEILGFDEIYINEIYSYNIASQKTFEKAGFRKHKENKNGYSYILKLK